MIVVVNIILCFLCLSLLLYDDIRIKFDLIYYVCYVYIIGWPVNPKNIFFQTWMGDQFALWDE